MDSVEPFFDLSFDDINVKENFEKIASFDNDNIRLYYLQRDKKGSGFRAIVLEFHSCGTCHGDRWEDPSLQVDVIIEVSALSDGVRHTWVRGNGHLYCPGPYVLSIIFSKIRELEISLCRELKD